MTTTTHVYRDFVFDITYRIEEPVYVVRFPDIPEIITSAETLTRAFSHACEALDLHLETLDKLGLPRPEPHHRLVVQTV